MPEPLGTPAPGRPRRSGWRGPVPSATAEAVLTGGSACLWYALAVLLDLESRSEAAWEDYPRARPFFLLAFAAGASLLVTWALRSLPRRRPDRFLDAVTLVRAASVTVVWLLLIGAAVLT